MKERFTRNDNLSPFFDSSKNVEKDISRTAFPFSRSHSFQQSFGMISVGDCFETLPRSTYKLSCNLQAIFRNPTVRKLINNCRLFVEYYYCKESDLWEGSHNLVTKGRSGNINLEYPRLLYQFKGATYDSSQGVITPTTYSEGIAMDTPDSLMDDFALPCFHYHQDDGILSEPLSPLMSFLPAIDSDIRYFRPFPEDLYINALPFVMYQKIYRDFYSPKNLLINNKNLFPDNEEHFILPYNATNVAFIDYDEPNQENYYYTGTSQSYSKRINSNDVRDVAFSDSNTKVMLAMKRFRQYRGDIFTTAFPFPEGIRGDVPKLELSSDTDNLSIVIPSQSITVPEQRSRALSGSGTALIWNSADGVHLYDVSNVPQNVNIGHPSFNLTIPEQNIGTSISTSITMNDIRTLEAFTEFKEKMAQTDGDYAEMIRAQFGDTKLNTSRRPVYIGGFYQDILVNSVFQTSESTESSPLGRQSGIGVSSGEHYIGDFYSPDFGYIMAVVSCVPEVYYSQGIEKMFSRRVQTDKYFPVMNDLPPEPVLNKELLVTSNNEDNEDVFAYVERNSSYKTRRNILTGKGRFYKNTDDPYSIYDNARAIFRRFDNINFNSNFVTAFNVDMTPFTVTDEMPLDIDFGSIVTAILPIPYVSTPGGSNEY